MRDESLASIRERADQCAFHPQEAVYLVDELEATRAALRATRDELAKWGWGDMHYGNQPQEARVVDALAIADAVLSAEDTPERESRPE